MKRFNVRFDPDKAAAEIKKKFERLKKDQAWKDEAAALAIRKIQGETRLGRYIETGDDQPELSDEWIEKRKNLAKGNPTGISFSPARSNLTLTGQLISSLKRIEDPERVIIQATGERQPYRYQNGKPIQKKKTPTNQELLNHLAERGRKMLGYNDKMVQQIRKKLVEHVRRFLLS